MTAPAEPLGFLLEEDEALKAKLSGITVSDGQRAARPVEVWYGQPDLEMAKRNFPYISIELIDINEDSDRVMVGKPFLQYLPDGYTVPDDAVNQILSANWFPTPYNLDYQVTAWSRHPRHDRQIVAELLGGRLPIRFGGINLPRSYREVRLDMLEGPRVADSTDENGKRLFRKVFTVRISTELFLDDQLRVLQLIERINVLKGVDREGFEQIEAVIS